ncbi:MAG: hypothetical protein GF388_10500 [Candidatus Aegiribacteria sp.]|nr:hypothetical protein [Candidatus Aegiribacteria sp.]MBD3295453.1 hypothetical protein [Candidatus Fermentibacteria bacterium]
MKHLIQASVILLLLLCPVSAQPLQPARLCAEWEPSLGTLIRWPLGIPMDLVVELALQDSLYVLVENPSQQSQAVSQFQSAGVNIDHCRFIFADTWSHWTRDWGPHWIFNSEEELGILDPVFDGYPWIPGGAYRDYTSSKGYEEDDLVNSVLAQEFACSLYAFPAYLTGGNFMNDGHGLAYSTRAMLTENEVFWTHSEFLQLSSDWMNLNSYFITVNPEDYGIQHIDCAAKLLNEETILLKQVDPAHPEYARLEAINDQLTTAISCYGREYEVVRIECGSYSGNDVAAYTNSYILNSRVFVPLFGISTDDAALTTYSEAMPGYEIIGVPYSEWYYYDALHCRTREVLDPGMLLIWHRPLDEETAQAPSYTIQTQITPYSGLGLIHAESGIAWRLNSGSWNTSPLSPVAADSLTGEIPQQTVGSVIDYYIFATDSSGRQETLPPPAPEAYYTFEVVQPSSVEESAPEPLPGITISPNPAGNLAVLRTVPGNEITVYGLDGRLIDRLFCETGELQLQTSNYSTGCYIIHSRGETGGHSCRMVVFH